MVRVEKTRRSHSRLMKHPLRLCRAVSRHGRPPGVFPAGLLVSKLKFGVTIMPYGDIEKRRANQRAYQRLHPNPRTAYHRRWYAKNAAKVAENSLRWHAEHPDKIAESKRRWRAENRDKIAAHVVVNSAIRDGRLIRGTCVAKTTQGVCGAIAEGAPRGLFEAARDRLVML